MIRKVFLSFLIVIIILIIAEANYSSTLKQFTDESFYISQDINQYVDPSLLLIDNLALHGEAFLDSEVSNDDDYYKMLTYDKDSDLYSLDAVGEIQENEVFIGNLTGINEIPSDGILRDEVNMALSFNEFFYSYYEEFPEIAWLYYTSENDFINIYPWVSSEEFSYDTSLKTVDFYTIATPANDPKRDAVWSPIYIDTAGKGLMVTLSKPIYNNDRFMGVVSIDITNDLLTQLIDSDYTSYLYDKSEVILATNIETDIQDKKALGSYLNVSESQMGAFEKLGFDKAVVWNGLYVCKTKIDGAPWEQLMTVSVITVMGETLYKTLPSLIIGIFLILYFNQIEKRRKSEREYVAAVKTTQDAFWLVDKNGKFVRVNDAACSMYGYSKYEYLSMTVRDILSKDSKVGFLEQLYKTKESVSNRFEGQHVRKDGTMIDIESNITYLADNSMYCLFNKDITDKRINEEKIRFLSYHDALTGLYNRAYFRKEFIIQDKEINLPISLAVGDVNGLKLTNDVFGHMYGDQLLCCITTVLTNKIRKNDIIARIGGDEFWILMPGTSENEAQKIIDSIYEECKVIKCSPTGFIYTPSISLGIATKTDVDQSLEEVLQDAENNMYRKKHIESKEIHDKLIVSIEKMIIKKSQTYHQHIMNVVDLALKMGVEMKLNQQELKDLELVAMFHDLGNVSINSDVLNKIDDLTKEEWNEVKKHPEVGYRIAKSIPELKALADSILHHHEYWDGSGYPHGLKGKEIPLYSRIIAVAAAYDAMTIDRNDRKAYSREEAKQRIISDSGTKFYPAIVEIFLKILD